MFDQFVGTKPVEERHRLDRDRPPTRLPPPPDLDCPRIPERNFRVLPPDPQRFDGDRDGIGCETR